MGFRKCKNVIASRASYRVLECYLRYITSVDPMIINKLQVNISRICIYLQVLLVIGDNRYINFYLVIY